MSENQNSKRDSEGRLIIAICDSCKKIRFNGVWFGSEHPELGGLYQRFVQLEKEGEGIYTGSLCDTCEDLNRAYTQEALERR